VTRRSVCGLVFAAVVGLVGCHSRKNDALVGKWISVARAKDGTATVTEFRPDGTFASAFEARLECSYRVNGDLMILSVSNPKTGRTSEDSAQVRVTGDTLYLKSPLRDSEEPMQRLTSRDPGDPPIVGSWGSGINGPHAAVANFTKDGKMTFRQTLRTLSGTYSVAGERLTLNFEGAPSQNGTFRFEKGVLVLTPETGEQQRLTRME
jgi:hypothetical protein